MKNDMPGTPEDLSVIPGAGQLTLRWSPVEGAVGYLIYRAEDPDGPWAELDHGNSDVRPVTGPPYSDADVVPGHRYQYAVAAVPAVDHPAGPRTDPVTATALAGQAGPLTVRVDASQVTGQLRRVWRMIGTDRLSQLCPVADGPGNTVSTEFREALKISHDHLDVELVRAHAIFHDDLGVFRMTAGRPAYDFSRVDRIIDELRELGLRPVVELSFMPHDLAADPGQTVFTYQGIISPPRDWSLWRELCSRLAQHCVDRYGIDEVSQWGFEVWNEPDLKAFWAASQADYFRLYDEAALGIKAVDERLRVGGPATAAVNWIAEFAAHVAETGVPADFISTHTYGNVPVDLRPLLARHGLADVEIWWTEWGVGHTHFAALHDSAYGAPFILRGMKSAQDGRVGALAYWVASDHFDEIGPPPRLFHGGFGLLTVGNLRKPRYWALRLAQELGDSVLATSVDGDGADSLVEAWAARHESGTIDILVWNASPSAAKYQGDPVLDRTVTVRIDGLDRHRYRPLLARVDNEHSNITRHLPADAEWPDTAQWAVLRQHDQLAEWPMHDLQATGGQASLELSLPMPGVARIRLLPES
jgi:xylan 1,4-beta-xylosidase